MGAFTTNRPAAAAKAIDCRWALIGHSEERKDKQLPLSDLLRQSVYSRLAGYEDLNDAERLSQDPTFRLIGSEKIWERGAALPSRLQV